MDILAPLVEVEIVDAVGDVAPVVLGVIVIVKDLVEE